MPYGDVVPTHAAPSALLRKLSSILSRDWLLDFVLTSPSPPPQTWLHPAAICRTLHETTVCTARDGAVSAIEVEIPHVQVPSFFAEGACVGFGVMGLQSTNEGQGFFKYICDVRESSYVIVRERGSLLMVCCFVRVSATKRVVLEVVVKKDCLRTMLLSDEFQGVSKMVVVQQRGTCASCAAATDSECQCAVVGKVKHPFDWGGMKMVLDLFAGQYEGFASMYGLHGARVTELEEMNVKTYIGEGFKQGKKEELISWAVKEGLDGLELDPRQGMITAGADVLDGKGREAEAVSFDEVQGVIDNWETYDQGNLLAILDGEQLSFVENLQQNGEEAVSANQQNRSGAQLDVTAGKRKRRRKAVSAEEEMQILVKRRETLLARMERNRQSARRSNMKRKLQNRAVRDEISKLKETEQMLRGKEVQLREENLRLREEVAARDAAS